MIAADSRPGQTILSRVDKEQIGVFVRQQSTLCLVLVDVREGADPVCVCCTYRRRLLSLSRIKERDGIAGPSR